MVESGANPQFPQGPGFYLCQPCRGKRLERRLALHLEKVSHLKTFTGHGDGYVTVNDRRYEQAVVVTAGAVLSDWPATDFASLTTGHFDYFIEMQPEVLLLGTGKQQQFAHPQLYQKLMQAGIAVEFMDTPAACRTYNILVAEDRKVVAAVLPS
ncbi:MAG: Mth938-like domain-containing protein [Sideroxydans sp.]|nr:Mth938-like domain-containing protein [Sideroxydans sp.]